MVRSINITVRNIELGSRQERCLLVFLAVFLSSLCFRVFFLL